MVRPNAARWRALLAALLAVLAVGACSGGDDLLDPGAQPAPTTAKGQAASTTSPPTVPARIIATAEGEYPGMVLELLGVRRTSGQIVTTEFAMRNAGSQRAALPGDAFNEPGVPESLSVGGAYLTDEVNRKKYLVLRDTAGACVCSRGIETAFEPGQRRVYFAKFPAPPESVSTITVVVPHFSPIDGVGISE